MFHQSMIVNKCRGPRRWEPGPSRVLGVLNVDPVFHTRPQDVASLDKGQYNENSRRIDPELTPQTGLIDQYAAFTSRVVHRLVFEAALSRDDIEPARPKCQHEWHIIQRGVEEILRTPENIAFRIVSAFGWKILEVPFAVKDRGERPQIPWPVGGRRFPGIDGLSTAIVTQPVILKCSPGDIVLKTAKLVDSPASVVFDNVATGIRLPGVKPKAFALQL